MSAWAKRDREGRSHALSAHSLDVAVVLEALLALPGFADGLERAAGQQLTPQERARMIVLAGLHDIGKAHPLFQAKALRPSHLSHCEAGFGLVAMPRGPLFAITNELKTWAGKELFAAVFAHHGTPVVAGNHRDPAGWDAGSPAGYAWAEEADAVLAALRAAWPLAFAAGPPLPNAPRLVHGFAGLLALADWIGSDRDFFPFADPMPAEYAATARTRAAEALRAIGLDRRGRPRAGTGFDAVSPHSPRAAQAAIGELAPASLVILEAETGSGKTEAALWHFARLHAAGQVEGLYFAVPTRAAARQLHRRVQAALDRVFGADAPEAVLAIPGQRVAGTAQGYALPEFATRWDDSAEGTRVAVRWAAEQATRFLAATVAVGTVDQALLAALQVRHAPMRGAALARNLLVIDEIHASDSYMTVVIEGLLADHLAIGGHALLMSATLGSAARCRFQRQPQPPLAQARATVYPAVWRGDELIAVQREGKGKRVQMETRATMAASAAAAEAIAAAGQGARVLVIRNTVRSAVETFRAIQEAGGTPLLMQAEGGPALHHARFAAEDRALLDRAVEACLGRRTSPGGAIVTGSQTLEQSLDIDADLLITDLCPVDVLLQRLGRLHRHANSRPTGFGTPRAIVLLPDSGLDALAGGGSAEPRFFNGLGAFHASGGGWGGIYSDLAALALTRARIADSPVWDIPAMNRDLVESCTHPEVRRAVIEARGWRDYESRMRGRDSAQAMMAGRWRLDRSRPLPERFCGQDETVMTRLGAMGPELRLPPGTVGPFGRPISRLVVPAWWARGQVLPEEPRVEAVTGGLRIIAGDNLTLVYTREGLAMGERPG